MNAWIDRYERMHGWKDRYEWIDGRMDDESMDG